MVAIDSKSNSTSNLVGIKENTTIDEVDMLFAELFALVHTENNEEKVDNNENNNGLSDPVGRKNFRYGARRTYGCDCRQKRNWLPT